MSSIKNNRLFDYFKALNRNEFNEFVRIQTRTPKSKTSKLLILLKEFYPYFDSPKMIKPLLYKKLYSKTFVPTKKRENQRFMDVINDLTQLVEYFITELKLREQDEYYERLKIQALRERGLADALKKNLDKFQDTLEKEPINDFTYYQKLHEIQDIRYNDIEVDIEVLKEADQALDKFYVAKKMRLIKEAELMPVSNHTDPIPIQQKEFVVTLAKEWGQEDKCFEIYYRMSQLFKFDDTWFERYEEGKAMYKANFQLFSKGEQLEMMSALVNSANHIMSGGNLELRDELYQWYKFGLKHDIFIQYKQMHEVIFSNIYRNLITYESFEAAQVFFSTHFKYLKKETKTKIEILANAAKAFANGNYKKVIKLLHKVQFRHYAMENTSKALLIRALYKDGELIEELENTMEAFNRYLDRKFKKHPVLLAYKNFLILIQLLRKYPYDVSKSEIIHFRNTNHRLAYSLWFKEEIEQLR